MSKYIIAVIIAIMAISGCSKDTKEQDKQNVAVSEAQKKEEPQQKAAQACVDQRIADFHKDMGADEPIRQDVLGEWEEECGMKASDSSNTQTTVAAVTTTTALPAPKKVKPGIKAGIINKQMTMGGNTFYMKYIVVTSIENEVSLESINANRGNCKVTPTVSLISGEKLFAWPYKMNFGQTKQFTVTDCADVIEIQIKQDGNLFRFDFQ